MLLAATADKCVYVFDLSSGIIPAARWVLNPEVFGTRSCHGSGVVSESLEASPLQLMTCTSFYRGLQAASHNEDQQQTPPG